MDKFQKARKKYRPNVIKVLFLAEAPPDKDSDRFFYFEVVSYHDSLFWELMRFVFPKETKEKKTSDLRPEKSEFLMKFMKKGYYLEDSMGSPFGKRLSSNQKVKLITANQKRLLRKLNKLLPDKRIPIILIANPVYIANYQYLSDEGFNVINKNPITFPFSNHQDTFRREISTITLPNERHS